MKKSYLFKLFIMGGLAFAISQILLRIPILQLLNGTMFFNKFMASHPLAYALSLAFSAGVFEETARFLFRWKFVDRDDHISQAISFGLGHGLVEVLFVVFLMISSPMPISTSTTLLAAYERVLAVIFHVGMTVLIWNGFLKDRAGLYLFLAMLCHGLFNSVAIFMGMTATYILLTVIAIGLLMFIRSSKKLRMGGF